MPRSKTTAKRRPRALASATFAQLVDELRRRPEAQELLYEISLTLHAAIRALSRRVGRPMPPKLPEWRDLTAAERKALKLL